jgi:hypothetical protein
MSLEEPSARQRWPTDEPTDHVAEGTGGTRPLGSRTGLRGPCRRRNRGRARAGWPLAPA